METEIAGANVVVEAKAILYESAPFPKGKTTNLMGAFIVFRTSPENEAVFGKVKMLFCILNVFICRKEIYPPKTACILERLSQ